MPDKEQLLPSTRKVTVGSIAGAAATILVWLLETTTTLKIPAQVTTALGTLITAAAVYQTSEVYYKGKDVYKVEDTTHKKLPTST